MLGAYAKFRDTIEGQIRRAASRHRKRSRPRFAFLMSPGASSLTGAVLPIDDGLAAALGSRR
jgi:hypothetical protein